MIVNLTKHNVQETVQQKNKPVIVDVFATWCGPCLQMKPYFEQLATELGDTYIFAELNVDESRELAISYNVTSVPTFIFIKNNTVVGREVGYMPKEDLKAKIEEYLGT
jgi:thioredoxin 1